MLSLGAHVGQQNMTMSELRTLWRRLDDARLDWISAWDHLYEAPPQGGTVPHFEAVATLGALCADTSHARIGCLVFYVGYRNPGLLAKAATTLDHISGGRFELGLGAGWHEWEAAAFGYDFPPLRDRFDMLEEAFPLIRSLLTEERTTHDGRWFRTENASCLPAPVNGRRLPIWIGGVGPNRTPELAVRYADGWNAAYVSADQYRDMNRRMDERCDSAGRDPASLERSVNLVFQMSVDEAMAAETARHFDEQWGDMAPRVRNGTLLGTPEQAVEQILRYASAGADGLNIALRAPWPAETLDAYLDFVVPAVRAELA
ncbi:MAG: LLM class flavin-dependent oxidoreductase [Acidimicrobiia bacterium]|nr:LLM class flavin-dependent oxidoreductase [Acidimicrobiia bacterium]